MKLEIHFANGYYEIVRIDPDGPTVLATLIKSEMEANELLAVFERYQ